LPRPDLETMTEYGGDGGVPKSDLQIDRRTGELYLNGSRIVTEKRFSSYERALATIGLVAGVLAAISAVTLTVVEVGRSAAWWI
jgi:hypothetical protein